MCDLIEVFKDVVTLVAEKDCIIREQRAEIDQLLAYSGAVEEIRSRYPIDVFPEQGDSKDCIAAKFARSLCDQIHKEAIKIHTETAEAAEETAEAAEEAAEAAEEAAEAARKA